MPREDPRLDAADPTAVLLQSLYGTQEAAANWEAEYASTLENLGFTRGTSSACIFYHREHDIVLMVHGDDFFAVGGRSKLDTLEAGLRDQYECKTQRLGWSKGRCREAGVLGKTITLDADGLTVEADPALIDEAINGMDLRSANAVTTPAVKSEHFGASSRPRL